MGYTTYFWGQVDVAPPLAETKQRVLRDWAAREHREGTAPSVWCQWVPTDDGSALVWDGREKFYEAADWMQYLLDRFISDGHTASGVVFAEAEPEGLGYFDTWRMDVVDNQVTVTPYEIPVLEWEDEDEDALEELDIAYALSSYSEDPTKGVTLITRNLETIHEKLGQPKVASALALFIHDAATVLPEAQRLKRAVARFLRE